MSKHPFGLGSAAALCLWAAGAVGGESGAERIVEQQTRTVVVHYSPAMLTSRQGTEALHSTLERAARRACGAHDLKLALERRRWAECYETALEDALEQVAGERTAAANPRERDIPRLGE